MTFDVRLAAYRLFDLYFTMLVVTIRTKSANDMINVSILRTAAEGHMTACVALGDALLGDTLKIKMLKCISMESH